MLSFVRKRKICTAHGSGEHTRLACVGRRPADRIPYRVNGGSPFTARGSRALPGSYGRRLVQRPTRQFGQFIRSIRGSSLFPRGAIFPLSPLPGIAHLPVVKSDYDGAWKDLLHGHLREVLSCYFPGVADAIDWSAPVRFLDQELRQLGISDATPGNRVDLLVEVRTFEGGRQTIYLHLEVQSFAEEDFTARLHACFQGLSRATGGDVVTLAVLADLQAGWKPDTYRYSRLGCEVTFRFPVCKLLEILPSLDEDTSLPALAAKAQIAALLTSSNPDLRMAARWRLTRLLLEQGYTRADVRDALRVVAWMMQLPRTAVPKDRNSMSL